MDPFKPRKKQEYAIFDTTAFEHSFQDNNKHESNSSNSNMIDSGIDERFKYLLRDKAKQPTLREVSIDNSHLLSKIRSKYFQEHRILAINTN